ncbi:MULTISPECIES: DUF2267 domain-containing protein [unclassified Kitasatospora]|uniref:DUF2267 domain-containing protein n=1 Tax=unclassified Kitasatospora TaxID=2633591 RepID=UPI0033D0860E
MTWHHLVQQVRDLGRYDTDQKAERVLDAVLTVLGSQLSGDERCDLAAALPDRARAVLAAQIPLTHPVAAPAFVEAVARLLTTTLAAARWDSSTVLTVLSDLVGEQLTGRLLASLPRSYALLFGRADLAAA